MRSPAAWIWFGLMMALAPSARAQRIDLQRARPITVPVRDGGIYHLATKTWTRHAQTASIGADIIYNNTCSTGYFGSLSGDRYVDEGRVPSPSSPNNLSSRPGCASAYTIDGFQIAYCTDQPSLGTYTVNFYESYVACATVVGVTPTAGYALTGLPASAAPPALACWIVTLDLDSPPLSFTMLADGDGTFAGSPNSNLFGWSMECSLPDGSQVATGSLIAGDFNACASYDGTRWDSPVNYSEAGTGMSTLDQFRIEDGPTTPGCYFYGGNPLASFHLEMYADACGGCAPSQPAQGFCFGDGTGMCCPCGNLDGADAGCRSSLGIGGKLIGITLPGEPPCVASILADSDGTPQIRLEGSQMPNSFCLYFQGTTQQNGGAGTQFGDGLRCAGGTVIRLGVKLNAGGASAYPGAGDLPISIKGAVPAAGASRTYQVWYRDAAAFCTASTFNLTNGVLISWAP